MIAALTPSPSAGAREEVRARNREALYALSRTFERCAGKRARRRRRRGAPHATGLLDPAAHAEPLSDAGAPGAAGAGRDAGRGALMARRAFDR